MSKKVYLDKDGNAVKAGSTAAAWVFTDGDERIEKFRRAIAAAGTSAPPAVEPVVEEPTVERVGRRGR